MTDQKPASKPPREKEHIFPKITNAKSLNRMTDWGYSGALLMVAVLLFDLTMLVLFRSGSDGLDLSDREKIVVITVSVVLIIVCLSLGYFVKKWQNRISALILLLIWLVFGLHLIIALINIFSGIYPGIIRPIIIIAMLYLLINGVRACFAAPKIKAQPDASTFE